MNANSQLKTPATNALSEWIRYGTDMLSTADISSARLDSEVLLIHLIGVPRTYIHAHPEHTLTPRQTEIYLSMLELRLSRVPVAYITSHKQFYGRSFYVSPSVLIPRPESETIIDIVKTLRSFETIIDIGCGSGCLGITIKCERPDVKLTLTDISKSALDTAKKNSQKHAISATFLQSNLLSDIGVAIFDVIVANLPYVDRSWQTSDELRYEPSLALYAQNAGLELIFQLLEQAPRHLNENGYLILESDPVQHDTIILRAKKHGLKHVQTVDYITVFTTA
jgi:release factor glutamine methyltransferase